MYRTASGTGSENVAESVTESGSDFASLWFGVDSMGYSCSYGL